jgi:hypothetical protein
MRRWCRAVIVPVVSDFGTVAALCFASQISLSYQRLCNAVFGTLPATHETVGRASFSISKDIWLTVTVPDIFA